MWEKFRRWWLFHVQNPVVRTGERGGFKWSFRRFWLDISTLSGNFKCRFIADEHPYAYLLAGQDDENVHGFAMTLYNIGKLLTTDQKFVEDIEKSILNYSKRLAKREADPTDSEEAAIAEVKSVQKYVEATPKERKKMERDVNGRFKKAIKEA